METTQPLTFNIRSPKEIKMFVEMIEEVYYEIENAEWFLKTIDLFKSKHFHK